MMENQTNKLPLSREWATSSNVKSASYDDVGSILAVEFKNGGKYQYSDVPAEIWEQMASLKENESIGSFISKNIRNKFKSEKLNP